MWQAQVIQCHTSWPRWDPTWLAHRGSARLDQVESRWIFQLCGSTQEASTSQIVSRRGHIAHLFSAESLEKEQEQNSHSGQAAEVSDELATGNTQCCIPRIVLLDGLDTALASNFCKNSWKFVSSKRSQESSEQNMLKWAKTDRSGNEYLRTGEFQNVSGKIPLRLRCAKIR